MHADHPLAIITGASAGIGVELARLAAADGFRPLLVARRRERLEKLAQELDATYECGTRTLAVDLAARGGADEVLAAADGERVEMLINNAGFGTFGPFAKTPLERTTALLDLNVTALTRLTQLCLDGMIGRRRGFVMNVASTAGFMPGPGMAAYYASKAYVLSFSEALASELKGSGVVVSALCPGPTRTEFQGAAGMEGSPLLERLRYMSAADVARIGYRGLKSGRPVVVTGFANKATTWLPRLLPRRLTTRIVGAIQSAKT